ncbi:hypothetical protein [Sulfitobacter sp. R18_1]|uniref:hypothetical protein n=1 Tax=Sulfitobacter sp. R18_1 TaxID=2821104 RepID=UPI001ADB5E33|nr:hypothetical protein [Sulfitobacter sp. R18_1]MBO9430604.1 hypothetical protein [Sulfitobacter sp. R18_1]
MVWRAHAQQSYFTGGAALRLAMTGENNTLRTLTDLTFTVSEYGEHGPAEPILDGPEAVDFMQAVMDAAYDYGLRPSRAQDDTAQGKHLEDMRDITRHLLKMPKE